MITPKGIEYLYDNKAIKKAYEFAKDNLKILPIELQLNPASAEMQVILLCKDVMCIECDYYFGQLGGLEWRMQCLKEQADRLLLLP